MDRKGDRLGPSCLGRLATGRPPLGACCQADECALQVSGIPCRGLPSCSNATCYQKSLEFCSPIVDTPTPRVLPLMVDKWHEYSVSTLMSAPTPAGRLRSRFMSSVSGPHFSLSALLKATRCRINWRLAKPAQSLCLALHASPRRLALVSSDFLSQSDW